MLNLSRYVVCFQSDHAERSTEQDLRGHQTLIPFGAGVSPLFRRGEFVPAGDGKDPAHRVVGDGVGTVVGDEHAKRHFELLDSKWALYVVVYV